MVFTSSTRCRTIARSMASLLLSQFTSRHFRARHSQTKTNTNQRNRVNGFFKMVDEHPEFLHRQAAWLALAFARTADSDQLHRVTLGWHISAPHRVLPYCSN